MQSEPTTHLARYALKRGPRARCDVANVPDVAPAEQGGGGEGGPRPVVFFTTWNRCSTFAGLLSSWEGCLKIDSMPDCRLISPTTQKRAPTVTGVPIFAERPKSVLSARIEYPVDKHLRAAAGTHGTMSWHVCASCSQRRRRAE